MRLHSPECSGIIPLLSLAVPCSSSRDAVCPPGCQGTLRAHMELLPTSTLRSLPAGLPNSHSFPALSLCPALLSSPRCRIHHSLLLNVMPLMTAQCSKPARSLRKASCPSRASKAPSSLESSASLPVVHSNPSSRSPINTWNRTGPGTAP